MIEPTHFPESISFYENGKIQLHPTQDLVTLGDLQADLVNQKVCGFKIFDMLSDDTIYGSYGFLYYPQDLETDLAFEIGNLIMSQVASHFEDQFLTPPQALDTAYSLNLLMQHRIQHIKQISFVLNERVYRLALFIFQGKPGVSGNA